MPHCAAGQAAVKVDSAAVSGIYFLVRDAGEKEMEKTVKAINSRKDFQKKLLEAQA